MLERIEDDGYGDVVEWQPHGRCFAVKKPEVFKDLLPRYFTLTKIASFQRQLNLYGFKRLSKGRDRNCYYHEFFLRGKPFLIQHMHRVKVKGTGIRARANPDQEPDFWKMPWVGCDGAVVNGSCGEREMDGNGNIGGTPLPPPALSRGGNVHHQRYNNSRKGSSSVVSHDEEEYRADRRDDVEEEEADYEPIPLSVAVTPRTESRRTARIEEELETGKILKGWGKPFYYLDSIHLPTSSPHAVSAVTPSSVASASSGSSSCFDAGLLPSVLDDGSDVMMMDDVELTKALNEIFDDPDIVLS